jgi:N-methylhydantoinase B
MGDVIFLNYGDTITCITASGGGYGNPLERDMEKVKEDVEMGLVSIENAKSKYGVIINPITHEIDYEESNRLRNIK